MSIHRYLCCRIYWKDLLRQYCNFNKYGFIPIKKYGIIC